MIAMTMNFSCGLARTPTKSPPFREPGDKSYPDIARLEAPENAAKTLQYCPMMDGSV